MERRLRLRHVYAIATGAMFSSGFFLLPGLAADETGPSLPLAYLLAGVLVTPAMLSVAELATAMPRAGGPYHFIRRSMGSWAATVGGIGLWLALIFKSAFALVGIGVYLSLVVDVPATPVAVGLAVVFTGLNVVGSRESARLQVVLVAILLLVLTVFVGLGGFEIARGESEPLGEAFSPLFTDGALGLFAAVGLVFVSYAGLAQVASVAGEVRDPGRNIPRGLVLALATATFAYVAGSAVMVAVLQPDELRDDETPVATAVEQLPLYGGVVLVVVAAVAAFASTGNAGIMSAARYPLALANDRLLWGRFARVGRFGTPTLSVVVTGAVTIGVLVLFDVEGIAKLGSAVILLMFGFFNGAVIVLRQGRVAHYRPSFRAPLYPWIQILGIVAPVGLIADMEIQQIGFVVGLVAVGSLWFLTVGRGRTDAGGTAAQLLRRMLTSGHVDDETLRRLQEEGPRPDDEPAEVVDRAAVLRLESGATLDAVAHAATAELASRMEVSERDASGWIADRRHLRIELEPGRSEVHQLRMDAVVEPLLVVAWSPAAHDDAGPEKEGGEEEDGDRRGAAVAILVGPTTQQPRLLRLTALLAVQLCDRRLAGRWADVEEPEAVRSLLADDVVRRQGGDPSHSRER